LIKTDFFTSFGTSVFHGLWIHLLSFLFFLSNWIKASLFIPVETMTWIMYFSFLEKHICSNQTSFFMQKNSVALRWNVVTKASTKLETLCIYIYNQNFGRASLVFLILSYRPKKFSTCKQQSQYSSRHIGLS
jgi:hypothetical protein